MLLVGVLDGNFTIGVFHLLVHCFVLCCLRCPSKPRLLDYYYVREGWRPGRWIQECILSVGTSKSQISRSKPSHPKNWYPIQLIFCQRWGKFPENVPSSKTFRLRQLYEEEGSWYVTFCINNRW